MSSRGLFPVTAWTLVERAVAGSDAGRAASLNELCERYWRPIYVFLRGSGRPPAEAEDLTQGFFAHLLEHDLLSRTRVREVRFRAYLKAVLEGFLANEWRRASAKKRQGGKLLDFAAVESWFQGASDSPASAFDKLWALDRLESALHQLRVEMRASGREWVVDALAKRFGLGPVVRSVADLGREYGVTENQLSVALHRARGRLRALILAEIRDSVDTEAAADEELGELFAAVGKR
jgi:RNA polymerase sigma-70 factor (ECF subfamily)